jgi:predicted CXXCH cytochrome family protein
MACDGETLRPFRPGEDLASAFVDAKPKVARKGWEHSTFIRSADRYSAQRCTDCHDPHGRLGGHAMLKDPTSETCLRCHGIGRARLRYQNHASLGDATKKPCWQCHRNAHAH